jgi:uncharacterized protein (TIGR03118 family)
MFEQQKFSSSVCIQSTFFDISKEKTMLEPSFKNAFQVGSPLQSPLNRQNRQRDQLNLESVLKLNRASFKLSGRLFRQTNLVTDNQQALRQAGFARARFTDKNLVNPWGTSFGPGGPFWISDNGTGVSTLYNGAGRKFPPNQPLVVTIPPPLGSPAGTTAAPTGQVFNATSDFAISKNGKSAPSLFIFATEDGTISGWNPNVDPTNAVLGKTVPNAVYKGLAEANNGSGNFLYGANFAAGTVDVFNTKFDLIGSFKDSAAPAGFAPFNIQNLNGKLYVTYAKRKPPENKDDQAGPGNGLIDVFDPKTSSFQRLASGSAAGGTLKVLNSPWGLALAPANFGHFSNDLLVGNFGSGQIAAFNPQTGAFQGRLRNREGKPIQIDGLWSLKFGNDGNAGRQNELFFTAGINDEQHGLFGKLRLENRLFPA